MGRTLQRGEKVNRVVIIPEWFFHKAQEKAQNYGRTLVWKSVYKYNDKEVSEMRAESLKEIGEEVERIGYSFFGEKIAETEKAVQFDLSYWNLRKAGRYITDAPVEMGWKLWIPKSVILK